MTTATAPRLGEYDCVVIGGGFFGCLIALHYASEKQKVLLVEAHSELMTRASYRNQARIHNGYHYPRSLLTALRSRRNFELFTRSYGDCVVQDFTKLYAVPHLLSKVSGHQFSAFCKRIEAPIKQAAAHWTRLFNPDLIESVFEVTEFAFDAALLREQVWRDLRQSTVEILLNTTVEQVSQTSADQLQLQLSSLDHCSVRAKRAFNCTYSQINRLAQKSQLPLLPLKHELAEMGLVEVPEPLKKVGVTVMCGPFFSCMPFPDAQLHSLSHVRYTPHYAWSDAQERTVQVLPSEKELPATHVPMMIADSKRYLPLLGEARYKSSLWEVKTVLQASEVDDSRPILFMKDHGLRRFHSILGGKIDNVFDCIEEIKASGDHL